MTRRQLATPIEQVSVEAQARHVRVTSRAQAALMSAVSMLAGMAAVLATLIAVEDRPGMAGILMGLIVLGGIAFGLTDIVLGRSLTRVVEGAAGLRRTAADRAGELARANAELRRRDQVRSELFSTMSHELRTPLNAIMGFSRALLDGVDGDLNEEQRADVGQIHEGGKGLLGIVNGVLELARLESGADSVICEPLAVGSIVESVVGLLRPLADAKRTALSAEVSPNDPVVLADEDRLGQVLMNLVGNAIKFTDAGSITVRTRKDGGLLIVSVHDTGIGIAPKAREMILEPFRQADQADARRHNGTGLGLAIAKQLVEMMGGQIRVDSGVGAGSTFSIALPVAPETMAESVAEAAAVGPARVTTGVLVVGDGAGPAALVDAVKQTGHDVTLASGESWRTIMRRTKPSAVLIDLMRPRAGAWQALAELRANPDWREVPVGLYSVSEGRGHVAMPGALDLLFESADEDELFARLESDRPMGSRPILVVGEDDLWRSRVAGLLQSRNYRTMQISSARQAMTTVQMDRFSGLVMDLLLPRPGVLALLSAIADDDSLARLPAILIGPSSLTPVQQRDLYLAISSWVGHGGLPIDQLGEQVRRALSFANAEPAAVGR
jgi:signal transduction histidine kinase/DNA-binding response OmpR family regulator